MKEYVIYVSWGTRYHIFSADREFLSKNNLIIGTPIKVALEDEAVAAIIKYGFKSITIREGYFIDIVVG